jgi:hypothetical protein
VTPSVSSNSHPVPSVDDKGLASRADPRCTASCTGSPADPPNPVLDALAAVLSGLSAADRTRLAALLLGTPVGGAP